MRNRYFRLCPGFTIIEVLAAVATIGVVTAVALVIATQIGQSVDDAKLESDVRALNRAIVAFEGSGGAMNGVQTGSAALEKLQAATDPEVMEKIPGFSGSVVDFRIGIRNVEKSDGPSKELKAFWDSTKRRFVTSRSGDEGIREFYIDDTVKVAPKAEEVRTSALAYSDRSSWIWDYEDGVKSAPLAPTRIAVADSSSTTPLAATAISVSSLPSSPSYGNLQPPFFSIPGGRYDVTFYSFTVSLTDPNPPGTAALKYSIDHGPWQNYTGPIAATPNSLIKAQSVSLNTTDWGDSVQWIETYNVNPKTLRAPDILSTDDTFGSTVPEIFIALTNPNDTAVSETRYRINGGPWTTYSGQFSILEAAYPTGAVVEAQVVPTADYYFPSTAARKEFDDTLLTISGIGSGVFSNPVGPGGMVTNLNGGLTSDQFLWGDDSNAGYSQSSMLFAGDTFAGISEGERFHIGSLNYYNGTIAGGSGADSVDLTVGLDLNINGMSFNPYFDFTFDLINTRNLGDSDNPWPDADFVKIEDPRADQTLVIGNFEYEFRIDFGETTANGFSVFDEFHVLEERDAYVNTYGTFVQIGEINATPPPSGTPPPSPTPTIFQNTGYQDDEELAAVSLSEVKSLETAAASEASSARILAEGAERERNIAVSIYNNILDEGEYESNDESRLVAAQSRAQAASDSATASVIDAETYASGAKTKADQLAGLAQFDPALEDEAKLAMESYQRAYNHATDTKLYANRAQTAQSTIADIITKFNALVSSGAIQLD